MLKKCYGCQQKKKLSEFTVDRIKKSGFDNYCKSCKKKMNKKYNDTHREENSAYCKEWRIKNLEYEKERQRKDYFKNREERIAYGTQYRKDNSESINKYMKKYYADNIEKKKKDAYDYYRANRDKILARTKKWYQEKTLINSSRDHENN